MAEDKDTDIDDEDDDEVEDTQIGDIFAMLTERLGNSVGQDTSVKGQMLKLLEAYAALTMPIAFKAGDFVRGKKLLTKGNLKGYERPHILLEILAEPIVIAIDPKTVGYSSAAKKYNAVIGQIVDGAVCRYYVDLAEFEPYPDADKIIKGEGKAS